MTLHLRSGWSWPIIIKINNYSLPCSWLWSSLCWGSRFASLLLLRLSLILHLLLRQLLSLESWILLILNRPIKLIIDLLLRIHLHPRRLAHLLDTNLALALVVLLAINLLLFLLLHLGNSTLILVLARNHILVEIVNWIRTICRSLIILNFYLVQVFIDLRLKWLLHHSFAFRRCKLIR